jgi:hypothetical protein
MRKTEVTLPEEATATTPDDEKGGCGCGRWIRMGRMRLGRRGVSEQRAPVRWAEPCMLEASNQVDGTSDDFLFSTGSYTPPSSEAALHRL